MIDGVILLPEMNIKNSVTNINISGTHSMDNKINYKIDFPLINYNKIEGNNDIDEKKYLNIFMEISGTTENYKVDVKESQMLKDFTQVIKQNLKQDTPKEDQTIELDIENEDNTIDID